MRYLLQEPRHMVAMPPAFPAFHILANSLYRHMYGLASSLKGYFNTSVNDILEATGLTKGGLYGHFKSKEDIWYAVYDRAVSIWRGIVLKNISGIGDPIKRIEQTIENNMQDYLGAEVFDRFPITVLFKAAQKIGDHVF